MTVDAVVRAESISKSVTAWGVMALVEHGVIGLDDPIGQHIRSWSVPESQLSVDSITIRRLLTGTSGMPLGTVGVVYPPDGDAPSLRESLSRTARASAEPGGSFSYSNVGFNLLELLVEDVTGRNFAEYMAEAVLVPIGMSRSSFAWTESLWTALPTGYDLKESPVPPYVYPEKASGGLFTTVDDLARFVIASMTGAYYVDHGVLSHEGVGGLHDIAVPMTGIYRLVADGYGFGHFVEHLPDGRQAVWHGGQGTGWMTHFHAVPSSGDGIVILTNSQRSWPLMGEVLTDWARWSGIESVKWGRLRYGVAAMQMVIATTAVASVWVGARLVRGLFRGDRRWAPLGEHALLRRALQAAAGVAVIAALVWAAAQPYLMVSSVFPGLATWAGSALLVLAIVTVLSALFPRVRP